MASTAHTSLNDRVALILEQPDHVLIPRLMLLPAEHAI